ncbi:MAG: transcriptional repressor [Myxococcales bacterium]|nr:transcriptional repressor [Myxococcales bacterium]
MDAALATDLKDALRAAGLRATQGRVAVLGHLRGAETPRSHGDVVEALAELQLDRASVYRNLMDLTRAGLLRRFDAGDHVWRFESARPAESHDHAHFVCTDCGTVQCLPGLAVDLSAPRAAPAAVAQNRVEVQLRGVCDDCD